MKRTILTAGLMLCALWAAQAQFIPGNLAVLRCGNGTNDIINKTVSQTIFIDQYTTNGAWLTNTTVAVTTNGVNAMVMEGGATSEGGLTRSMDRTLLAFTGYNTNVVPGVEYDSQTAAAVPRNIGTVDAFGSYSNVQVATGDFTKQDPRFVATDGTNNFWAVGGASGVVYLNPPTSANTPINNSIPNNRAIRIFNGNIFFTSQKSTPVGLYTFSGSSTSLQPVGLVNPNTPFSYGTNLLVPALSGNISDFAVSPDGNTIYVADTALGIQKYTINGSMVTSNYTIAVASGSQPKGAFALAVDFSGAYPIIYATTEETNSTSFNVQAGNHLVRVVDTGASATFTALAQAKTNEVFRGIDFTPDLRPLIVTQPTPANNSVAFGTTNVTITVVATSPFALSYQWQQNGTNLTDNSNITGSTSSNVLTFAAAMTTNSGNYTVIITNYNGSQYYAITSAVAVLSVSASTPPSITIQPTNQSDYLGGTASFTVAATGTPTPVYQWNEVVNGGIITNILADNTSGANGETYNGSTNATLFISNFTTNDSGNYYFATITNSAGSTNSQNAYLTVLLVPPSITTQPSAQTVLPGQTATFSISASGSYLGFQWMYITNGVTNNLSDMAGLSGEIFSGTASSTLQISSVSTNDAGYYAVAVTNGVGATNSQSVLLTVLVLPPPSFINYSNVGSVYTQNFDSLPSPGAAYTNTVQPANPVLINGINYSFGNANPIDFAAPILATNLPGGLGLSNTMSGWYEWVQGAGFNRFGADAGDYTTGGAQSFGPTNSYAASTNRALGLLTTSSTLQAAFAARFINNTGSTLSNMNLSFTGELWRQSNLPKTLSFYYVIDTTGTNTFDTNPADFIYLANLNVTFPTNGADSGGVPADGTLSINQTNMSVINEAITNWPPGAALWLVWEYTDSTGKAQGIGIDNLSFSVPASVTAPTVVTLAASNITASSAMLNATVNPNSGTTAYWFQYGTNTSYGCFTTTNNLAAGSSSVSVSNLIGGLLQGTAYHYLIVATNSAGTSSGADMNFTTLAVTPFQLAASGIGGVFSLEFSNVTGASFSVLSTNDLTIPLTNWPVVGQAVESPAGSGYYEFTNSSPTNAEQFYRLKSN